MSHLYRYFKDGRLVTASTPGAVRMREPEHAEGQIGTIAGDTRYGGSQLGDPSAYIVLEPTVKPKAVESSPDDLFQTTIVPSQVAHPTAALMGHEFNGGYGVPWTVGPVSLHAIPVALGSMLFMIGNGVAISLGIGGESDLFSQVLVNYHRRGVGMRIHTGIGTARGGASRDPGGGNAVVPYGSPRPRPPSGSSNEGVPEGPVLNVPGLGPLPVPAEEHGEGMHQHAGSSPIERWKEDFGALWGGFSDFLPWLVQ